MNATTNENDLICDQEWSLETISKALELASDMKANPRKYHDALDRKSICLYFFNPSLRTRNSFEVGINQLGGHGVFVDSKTSWLGQESESVKDTACVLSRYFDLIAVRMFPNVVDWVPEKSNEMLREFARWSRVPVINLEDDMYHPCQSLADALTIKEVAGKFKGTKLTITWAYHPKPLPMAVPNSMLLLATRLGMDVTFSRPDENYDLPDAVMATAKANAKESGGNLSIATSMKEGCDGADFVYVKSWGSKNFYGNAQGEKKVRMKYRGEDGSTWMLTPDKMAAAKITGKFMHCLPVRRNIEVADAVIDDEQRSIVYDEAENRMHVQKAIMTILAAKGIKTPRS
ncbi:MAG: N-acetylornithine carbamoyltransferase [Candidatus Lokiarchaeota archaeon]|nr:N-acetylornithine carbamoyltransferase [Candidatus Lokiarchaeota archaeon]